MHPWLARVRHDLIKRVLWAARDLRDTGAAPGPADVRALRAGLRELVDPEGTPIDARSLWALLLRDSPSEARSPLFEEAARALGEALERAAAAVDQLDRDPARAAAAVQETLRIEPAFEALARSMNR
jgi:hypothetical protein